MKLGKFLLCIIIVSLIMSMAIPLAIAKKPPKPPGGDDPPADPVIVFCGGENVEKLKVMNGDGSNEAVIYRKGGHKYDPTWSPDGSSVAFTMGGSIWAIDVTVERGRPKGSNLRQLTTGGSSPAWSPAGDEIAVVSGYSIAVFPATGGPLEIIYTPEGGTALPTWNADGSQLAFVEYSTELGDSIKIMDRETKTITNTLVQGEFWIGGTNLDWARTQDVLTFGGWIPNVPGPKTVYTLDIATGTPTIITEGNYPTWSPDDSQIAYQIKDGTAFTIRSITLSTGDSVQLSRDGWWPDWKR